MNSVLLTVFITIIVGFLVVDLGFLNRKAHKVSLRSALWQSLFWVVLTLGYSLLVYIYMGSQATSEFLGAYVTEKMLSVDNLFVILLLFNFFNLEEKYHHMILFWGILGAVVFRGIFITVGSFVISQFHWVLYVFGAVLVYTGIKLLREKKEEHADFKHNRVLKLAQKYLPFTSAPHTGKFMLKEQGKWKFTVLFMAVLLVETTDIVFAVDSIPAAFAISQDSFLVFTSNIFAVMGLRALFFLIEGVMHRFHHLQKGLAFILVFIGVKMFSHLFHLEISAFISMMIIILTLGASLVLSVIFPKKL